MADEGTAGSYLLGTPLPELDESDIPRKKPIPIEEQIVTDENGRRRFHGAFTGGFSAGYFNTAGSRDGWTPAHFKSSRSSRNEHKTQRPIDFMDAEDMGSFGFATKGLKTSEQFRSGADEANNRKRPLEQEQKGPIPGEPVLEQFLKPVKDTIGVRLLRNMGWKPGQGIGPRLTKMQKKQREKATLRMFQRSQEDADKVINSDEEDLEEMEKYKDFLFAPDDIPDFVAKPKDNLFGIGYSGLDRTSVLSSGHINLFESSLTVKDNQNKTRSFKGQAFGVGAYEEDDEDIYGKDDLSRYDFELGPAAPDNRGNRKSRWNKPEENDTDKIIEGFKRASLESTVRKKFPPPPLPKNFQPKVPRKSRFEASSSDQPSSTTSNPTPEERRQALAISSEEPKKPEVTESDEQLKKLLSSGVSETASQMSSFKPFARDPEKQARYEKYLVCLKNRRYDALPLLQPKDMTQWEREREKVEFERAALLYKPLNSGMNSKFVSAGSSEDVADPLAKVEDAPEEDLSEEAKAARMKMFGKLTRTREEWHPAKMLCVRFNVKHPYGDYSVVGVPKKKKGVVSGLFDSLKREAQRDAEQPDVRIHNEIEMPEIKTETQDVKKSQSNEVKAPVEEEPEAEPPKEKPSIDLFKAIFLDSSDEDEPKEEEQEDRTEQEEKPPGKPGFGTELVSKELDKKKPWEEKKENILRNRNPAKGIFANIDFDALNQKKKKVLGPENRSAVDESEETTTKGKGQKSRIESSESEDEDAFGPAKPASATISAQAVQPDVSKGDSESGDDGMEWTERTSSSHKHKKSKKKKRKKEKKAKKAKKSSKKKKRKRSSSSSSSSSSD